MNLVIAKYHSSAHGKIHRRLAGGLLNSHVCWSRAATRPAYGRVQRLTGGDEMQQAFAELMAAEQQRQAVRERRNG